MRASASLTVDTAGGRAFAVDIRSEPPFAIRQAGDRFLIVGSAAAPVRGDELCLSIEVAAGATADIATVAATIVWPGPAGDRLVGPSRMTTTIRVGTGGHVRWRPEPTISVAGSFHVAETWVELADGATCEIAEEYSLGRCGEPSGSLTTVMRVARSGRPLIHHGECFGPEQPGAGSVVGVASFKHVIAAARVGGPIGPPLVLPAALADIGSGAAAWLPVADDAAVALAAGNDRPTASALLREVSPLRAGVGVAGDAGIRAGASVHTA